MGPKSKNTPRPSRKYGSLKDILEEEEFHKSIEKRERRLQNTMTEKYFDRLLSSRLQSGDPFIAKLARMSVERLEDEYYDLSKRLPEPEYETTTKQFESSMMKGTRTVRIIKQPREYYMINMIRAELRRRRRGVGYEAANTMKGTQPLQATDGPQAGIVRNPGSRPSHDNTNGILSESVRRPGQAEYDILKNENLALTNAVIRLKKRRKADHFTPDQLRDLAESNRKKNGKINYLKISKIMGVHHTTAKRRLNSHGIR